MVRLLQSAMPAVVYKMLVCQRREGASDSRQCLRRPKEQNGDTSRRGRGARQRQFRTREGTARKAQLFSVRRSVAQQPKGWR